MRAWFSLLLSLSLLCTAAEKELRVPVRTEGVTESEKEHIEGVIEDQLALSADTAANPALADDIAFFVRHHYLESGYLSAKTEWRIEGGTIVITVDDGGLLEMGEIVFQNNPGLDEEELRRYLLRPTRERVGRGLESLPYVENEISAGLDLVLRYLLSQGYQDAQVSDPVMSQSDDGKANLNITLTPGPQWKIGTVTVEGLPPKTQREVTYLTKDLPEQVANEAQIERTRRGIMSVMQERGYYAAAVDIVSTRGVDQHLDVRFLAKPGALHHISEIVVDEGLSRGASRLIRAAFKPSVGRTYEAERMQLAHGSIVDTGLFEHLEMEPEVLGENQLKLVFKGQEAPRYNVTLAGGFDTWLGAIASIEWKDHNVWNSGGMLRVKAIGTMLGFTGELQWKNPAIFGSRNALSVDLMPEIFSFEGYTRYSGGLRFGLSRKFTQNFSAETYLGASFNAVTTETLTELETGPQEYAVANAGGTLIYEARDNPVSPTRGWYGRASGEVGSIVSTADLPYAKAELALAYYLPLTKRWRAAFGASAMSISTNGDVSDVPIDMRVYNGGPRGVRSFLQRRLGVIASDNTPLGGLSTQTYSTELSYEIIKNLEIAGFVDAGNVSLEGGLTSMTDMRYAAGMGFRYRLPFGPLRVDYGVNLNRRTGEAIGALHIGFGFAF